MGSSMTGRRTLQASAQGLDILKQAIKRKKGGQTYLAGAVGCARQTIWSLLQGNPTDCDVFMSVCSELGLDWESIAEPEAAEPEADYALDALVQHVRQKVHANIQERCGTMRVLDMTRPIELDTIYTDVNILQEITGRRRLDLAELLTHCSLNDFDRPGFAHAQTERRAGLTVVEEFNKLILLGKPGAGKTTFLKRLAMLCNTGTFQGHQVPVFITLKDFGDSSEKPKLLSHIDQGLKELGVQESQSIEQILEQGRGFLLLDGLDEVSERSSKQVLQEIQAFSDRFPQNTFVVSCRIAAKEFTFQQFTEVEVADFSDEQIADFAQRWFQAKQLPGKTERFLEKLKNHPRIKELATNPLLLTLLCLVFEGRTDFPANRSELYEEGLDVLLKKWDGTRSIEREQVYRELSLKRKEDLLSQLAFTTFESGNYFFKQKDAERLIETYIQNLPGAQTDPEALRIDSEAVLKSIEAQHGLLVERARGIYSFSHLTFHEYFTARELETRDDLHQTLMSHLTEKQWREVFLLTIGMVKSADSLLLLMKSKIDEMVSRDEKLQQFLAWVQQKSSLGTKSYKPAAIRALYLADANTFLGRIDLDFAIDVNFPHARIQDRDIALDIDLTLAFKQALDLTLNHNFADLAITLNRARNRILDSVLRQSLQLLQNQILTSEESWKRLTEKDWKHLESWWQVNSSDWIAQLRTVMIEHRNIGHDWQLTEEQKKTTPTVLQCQQAAHRMPQQRLLR